MSSPWVPVEMVKDFIEHLLGGGHVVVKLELQSLTTRSTLGIC